MSRQSHWENFYDFDVTESLSYSPPTPATASQDTNDPGFKDSRKTAYHGPKAEGVVKKVKSSSPHGAVGQNPEKSTRRPHQGIEGQTVAEPSSTHQQSPEGQEESNKTVKLPASGLKATTKSFVHSLWPMHLKVKVSMRSLVSLGVFLALSTWLWPLTSRLYKEISQEPPFQFFVLSDLIHLQEGARLVDESIQHENFTFHDRILTQVRDYRTSLQACCHQVDVVSIGLGTQLTPRVKEWVFEGNCTSALAFEVHASEGALQTSRKCTKAGAGALDSMVETVYAALKVDDATLTSIAEEQEAAYYGQPFKFSAGKAGKAGKARTPREADEESSVAKASQSLLRTLGSDLAKMTSTTGNVEAMLTATGDEMVQLDSLLPQAGDGRSKNIKWDCKDFDVERIDQKFRGMAGVARKDGEAKQEFLRNYVPQPT